MSSMYLLPLCITAALQDGYGHHGKFDVLDSGRAEVFQMFFALLFSRVNKCSNSYMHILKNGSAQK